jgi:hypothetical protein
MALITDIADAVAAELNAAPAGSFDPAFTAVRRVLPAFDLAELVGLKVSVVPKATESAGSTRAACLIDCRIDIGVQQKLGRDLDAGVAALCGLVEAIAAYLRRRPLTGMPHAAWVRTQNDPVYAPDHLAQQRTFTSVLTLTYRSVG